MAKYTSGRQKNFKVGIKSYSEDLTSLEVIGKVGIGTTNATSNLYVVGDGNFTGVITATSFYGPSGNLTDIIQNKISGFTVSDEGVIVGTSGSVSVLNFVGPNITATASGNISTITVADYVSNAGIATALQYPKNFSITGNFVTATAISFDGTGNVALAATITPDSIGLGTYTSGDYVKNILETSNQITVTGGTGESSTPTLSIPNQFTAPQDVTVSRDLQVDRNLNVTGNITIGGTTAFINVQQLRVSDSDLVLGFRTDGSNNDVSNDNTANHGGIAIASTEGSPLISIYNPGIGESTLPTYKKIMWFKSGSFAGLNTDAWLFNYGVGIGSTQFPTGTRLAAGSVQFTENDLVVVKNINASGIVTASTFIKINGTSSQFLKADGSVDSNTYLTAETDTLNSITGRGNVTSNGISVGILTATLGNFSGIITSSGANISGVTTSFGFNATVSNDYKINNTSVLTSTTLGSGVINSSLTSVGTLGSLTVANVASASTFAGNLTGTATTANNISSGSTGNIPYQSSSGITTFLTNGNAGFILQSNGLGNAPSWVAAAPSSAISGLTIQDNTIQKGVANSITTLNFSGLNVSATASGGISTISISNNLVGTALSISGISTLSSTTIIGGGTSTGTTNQILQVTGISSGVYIGGSVGIGSTNPTSKLYVVGDTYITGILTVNRINSGVYGEFTGGSISGSNIVGTSLSISGISTSGGFNVTTGNDYKINNTSVLTSTTLGSGVINSSLTSVGTLGSLTVTNVASAGSFVKSGGTSSQFLKADGSVDSSTYLTTTGSGTNLTGIVTSIIAGTNISVSASTGQVTINSTSGSTSGSLDILEVMLFA